MQITGDLDDYYYDEGEFFPPTGRARKQLATYLVIMVLNVVSVLSSIVIWKYVAFPMLEPDDIMLGSILFAGLTTLISLLIDALMDGIAELGTTGVSLVQPARSGMF